MKRFLRAEVVSAVLLVSAGAAFAQKPFADVPRGHWAYDCVLSMHGRMILWKYPDGTFGGKRLMTRYEFAVIVARSIPQAEYMAAAVSTPKCPLLDADDFGCLNRMVAEFTPELRILQVNTEALHGALRRLRFAAISTARRVTPLAVPPPFSDVPRGHWAYDAVCFVADRGLMVGYPG